MNRLTGILGYCLLLCSLLLGHVTNASTTAVKEEPEIDLQDLTNEELEQICTIRGFELNKEVNKETGKPVEYLHDDYIEAARQCLDIEAEMEKIIQENPEILKEIEEEAEAMRKDQEQLIQQKNELEEKLKQAQKAQDGVANAVPFVAPDAASDDVPNTASDEVPDAEPDVEPENKNKNNIPSQPNSSDQNNHVENDEETIDLDELINDAVDEELNTNSNDSVPVEENKEDIASSTEDLMKEEDTDGPSTVASEKEEDTPLAALPSSAPTMEQTIKKVKDSDQPLVTIREVIMEFREQVRKDLDRIGKIVLPPSIRGPLVDDVLKPAYKVGKRVSIQTYTFMKRYLSVFFAEVKGKVEKELEKRKEQNAENVDSTTPVQDMKLQ